MGNAKRHIQQVLVFLKSSWAVLGITVVVLILLEAVFRAGFAIRDRITADARPDRRVLAEGYDGATWPIEHYRELELLEDRWSSYVYFRQKPYQGQTITIGTDGLRATWKPPSPVPPDTRPRTKLMMLGGSSLWGFGARDDQTIPSHLARILDQRGYRVELKNLAEIGYVNTQELIALMRELQAGYRPDIVIFYDGVNDTTSALLEGEAGLTTNEVNRRREFNLLQSPPRLSAALISSLVKDSGSFRFAQAVGRRAIGDTLKTRTSPSKETMDTLATGVIDRYVANIAIAETMGRGFGFRPLFYWQPVIFDKLTQVAFEREESARYGWSEGIFHVVYGRIRDSTELKRDPAFRDLSRLFAESQHLIFIDFCHTTESANAGIAAVMADGVIETMERRLADGRKPIRDDGGPGRKGVE